MTQPKNLLQIFQKTTQKSASSPAVRYKADGAWQTLTWSDIEKKVLDLAGGLKKLGIQKGDRVCIFSKTRYEWTVSDMAILANGGVAVPIYESSLPDQAVYILKNSGAKIAIVEDSNQLKKIEPFLGELPDLKQIIVIDLDPKMKKQDGVYSLDEVLILGAGNGRDIFNQMAGELDGDSEASFVYTSGTTGPPKGAILTHGNFLSEVLSLKHILDFPTHLESLLFLPLAHIFARAVQYAHIETGFIQNYAESIDRLLDNLAEVKPHIMPSVPRIFEEVHTRVMQGVESGSELKKKIFNWSVQVGEERARYTQQNKAVPLALKAKWALAYKLVFSKLHARLGGRIDYFISGGAPLSKDIGAFFSAAGFLILEGYGLTETTAAITCNSRYAQKIGSVGKPVPGAQIKIAEDGEILVKGPMVLKGYYQRPEDTKAAIDEKGWFHTGDIGEIDSDGFVKITDRKKDIIVTAAGKNVAPQNIENLIKTDPLISQVMVHGDKRKFLTALVTLNKDEVVSYAKANRINFNDYGDLVKNEKIYQLIKARIDEKNKHLAKYETIKKFAILDNDFSVETGELTPTLKVKRKFASDKCKNILDQFYQE